MSRACIDVWCLIEMARFTTRHLRYGLIALVLVGASLPAWGRRRVLRTGFCFLQIVDDWLDGDRRCDRDPVVVVRELQEEIRTGTYAERHISHLGRSLVADLDRASVVRLLALLDTMAEDGERRRARAVWGADRLRAHHRATFGGSFDLVLAAVGARTRMVDLPELLDVFGVVSTLRDLEADLARGLCNVPAEVVGDTPWDPPWGTSRVLAWIRSERAFAREALARAESRLATLDDPVAARVFGFFVPSLRRRLVAPTPIERRSRRSYRVHRGSRTGGRDRGPRAGSIPRRPG